MRGRPQDVGSPRAHWVESDGSTGLYLPNSDLDLVVMKSGCEDVVKGLKALATSLTRRSLATDIMVCLLPRALHVPREALVPVLRHEAWSTEGQVTGSRTNSHCFSFSPIS